MYEVAERDFGFEVSLGGVPDGSEIEQFCREVQQGADRREEFYVLADLRNLDSFSQEGTKEIIDLMSYCKRNGMERSASVVEQATTALQIRRLESEAGLDDVERVISTEDTDDWRATAMDWIEDGVEPEE
jgi:hypothetical protein